MNKKMMVIICLLAIIIINLAISYYFIQTKEGLETQAQIHSANAQKEAANNGLSSGFAGSGTTIDISNIDYTGLYGNSAPNKNAYQKITRYDTNNYNVQYHDDVSAINSRQDDKYGLKSNSIKVKDQSGNIITMTVPEIQGSITYYEPGTYRFGASSYVPNYEDSVFLSKTTGMSNLKKIQDTASMLGGFCQHYKNNPDKLEEICRSTDKNKCGSTSCCVLLGGSKCVYGNENGPHMKANYSDIFVRNKDFYYFQGKCYGNCN
jgi:hypothetical protein